MKIMIILVAMLCCVLLILQPVNATMGHYKDTMTDEDDNPFRLHDNNLQKIVRGPKGDDFNQYMVGADKNGEYIGCVRYHVRGVQTLSLRIYSSIGTCALTDGDGGLETGKNSPNPKPDPRGVIQAMYNPADRNAYAFYGGWHMLDLRGRKPAFIPVANGVDGRGLINYGVNVYVLNGNMTTKERITSLTRTAIELKPLDKTIFVIEDFSCTIPAWANHIWVEINDVAGNAQGDAIRTSLAWVAFDGAVNFGPPPPESSSLADSDVTKPETSVGSESGVSSEHSVSSKPAASSESGQSSGSGNSSYNSGSSSTSKKTAATSSKFEGVITSSQSSSEPKDISPSLSSQPKPSAAVPPDAFSGVVPAGDTLLSGEVIVAKAQPVPYAEGLPNADAPDIYDIVRENTGEDRSFRYGIIVYIIIVVCLLLYLLIRPREERK